MTIPVPTGTPGGNTTWVGEARRPTKPIQASVPIALQRSGPLIVDAAITIVRFVVAFVVFYLVGLSVATGAVRRGLRRRGSEEALIGLATSLPHGLVATVAVAIAATIAGLDVLLSALAILGGALVLSVGLAGQHLIANFVAGLSIAQDVPLVAGDWIEWDGNGGVVRDVSLRVTRLETVDNELATLPNADLANTAVVNNVANDRRRVSVGLGIGYDDIEAAPVAINEEAAALEATLDAAAPAAPVLELVELGGRPLESTLDRPHRTRLRRGARVLPRDSQDPF